MSAAFADLLAAMAGPGLRPAEAETAFALLLEGAPTPAQTGAFLALSAMAAKESSFIAAGARAMRARMIGAPAPPGAIDVSGTGGDGAKSFNVSSAVAFVVAACGVPVAKHGNRAASSRSGAADVLEALGCDLAEPPERAFTRAGLAFLFAQAHHPALAGLAGPRRDLRFRTVFNLLGPLANPCGVTAQLVGVYALDRLESMAEAIGALGAARAWVVHGAGGLDEIAPHGPTDVAAFEHGQVRRFIVSPEQAGLEPQPLEGLRGGDALENAAALVAVLEGGGPPAYRTAVALNAAAALVIANAAADLREGASLAVAAIADGRAQHRLRLLVGAPTP